MMKKYMNVPPRRRAMVLGLCSLLACGATAQEGEEKTKLKFYGFIRNEFYINSRQNEQANDGIFHSTPKPVLIGEDGKDKNAIPEAEMLSICTRLGLDVSRPNLLGAYTTAKLEADFAGASSTYFVLRLRHAYAKFSWEKSDLLIGQTWHPMCNVAPTVVSLNTGAPFQPFNRSPQVRYTYRAGKVFSVSAAASYQMQYSSKGPDYADPAKVVTSPIFMKRALLPDLFVGAEARGDYWLTGVGFETKTIKPSLTATNTSFSAAAYTQYIKDKFQFKAKALWGQNMSDCNMLNGYGVSRVGENGEHLEYTDFNMLSSWVNVVYGKKWRIGMYAGFAQNFGTDKALAAVDGKYSVYSRGFYESGQLYADQLYRVSVYGNYTLKKLSFGLEYNYSATAYGTLQADGRTAGNVWAGNHRLAANVFYHF